MKKGVGNRGSSRWLLDLGVGRWKGAFAVGKGEEMGGEGCRIYCWVKVWDEHCRAIYIIIYIIRKLND